MRGKIPDEVLCASVEGLCGRALDLGIWGGNPCLLALSRLGDKRPQGPQDRSNGLQKACRQTLKDLFVHAAAKNGFVLIWDIQLQERIRM